MERGSVVENVFRKRATVPTGMYSHGRSSRLKREDLLREGREEYKRAYAAGETDEQKRQKREDEDLMSLLRDWELDRLQRFAYQLNQMVRNKQDALRPTPIP
jgi:hypothetical protein